MSTESRFARFPALAPGDYEFQVVALNEDNVRSSQPAKVSFQISPPYWKTWWFQIGCLLASGLIIGWILNTRQRRIRKQEIVEQEYKDKLSELRTMALQTQMNPHFIFNSLNAIQHFLVTNDEENAMLYLSKFAKLIRSIFEHSKEKVISLDKELDFLDLYVSLEKLRFKEKVDVQFEIEPKIEDIKLDFFLPPLLIQPIIENAFKHGLFHKNGGGNLRISFSNSEEDWISCEIEDDGIGRKRANELNIKQKYKEKSSGLNATFERIGLLNNGMLIKDEEMKNQLIVTDLYDKKKNPCGTKVEIHIKNQF